VAGVRRPPEIGPAEEVGKWPLSGSILRMPAQTWEGASLVRGRGESGLGFGILGEKYE
jgi:hypothetical protein